ncbi:MAG: hypothetical protein OXU71_06820 [Gammaproteobacteria bacterium]|nr:hypothetical protein [Gammaproteobacteria bacterium]
MQKIIHDDFLIARDGGGGDNARAREHIRERFPGALRVNHGKNPIGQLVFVPDVAAALQLKPPARHLRRAKTTRARNFSIHRGRRAIHAQHVKQHHPLVRDIPARAIAVDALVLSLDQRHRGRYLQRFRLTDAVDFLQFFHAHIQEILAEFPDNFVGNALDIIPPPPAAQHNRKQVAVGQRARSILEEPLPRSGGGWHVGDFRHPISGI